MISVDVAHATPEQLERLGRCPEWLMPMALYAEIRKGTEVDPFNPPYHLRATSVKVTVNDWVPTGHIIGLEPGDKDPYGE